MMKWLHGLLFLSGTAVALYAAVPPGRPLLAETTKDNSDDAANPYSVIVERNIFHLNPLPPPPEPEKPKVELPVVKITGFINIGNQSKVLFVSQPKDKKTEPIYYSLSEGEKSANGKLELVKIHPAQEGVDVINDGTLVTLTVKDDSLAPAQGADAAPPAKGGPPGNPPNGTPGRPPFQGRPPPAPGAPGPGGNGFSSPIRRHIQQ